MSEEKELKRIGAAPVKNSGRGTKKGDGKLGPFLVDVKEYEEGFRVTRAVWAKASSDVISRQDVEEPLLMLALRPKGTDVDKTTPLRVIVTGEAMWLEMYEAWKEKHGQA